MFMVLVHGRVRQLARHHGFENLAPGLAGELFHSGETRLAAACNRTLP
jgi:hypothetical protein